MTLAITFAIIVGYWAALSEILTYLVPYPKLVIEMENSNPKTVNKQYYLYIANYIAWLHGPVVALWCFYIIVTEGVTYNQLNKDHFLLPILVTSILMRSIH